MTAATAFGNITPGEWYSFKRSGDEITITGFDPNNRIGKGSTTLLNLDYWTVVEIQRRNHAGNFVDENNRKNAFYTAILNYLETDDEKAVKAKYSATHHVQKRAGASVDLTKLKPGESVVAGDGIRYHWLITKK